mmetsp:Transcript_81957/g.227240  ORF Transcript_81957/g.227240 Transcript_81957/m.227240 type:complete len:202 (-) Transcript_81957:202-807(-)
MLHPHRGAIRRFQPQVRVAIAQRARHSHGAEDAVVHQRDAAHRPQFPRRQPLALGEVAGLQRQRGGRDGRLPCEVWYGAGQQGPAAARLEPQLHEVRARQRQQQQQHQQAGQGAAAAARHRGPGQRRRPLARTCRAKLRSLQGPEHVLGRKHQVALLRFRAAILPAYARQKRKLRQVPWVVVVLLLLILEAVRILLPILRP